MNEIRFHLARTQAIGQLQTSHWKAAPALAFYQVVFSSCYGPISGCLGASPKALSSAIRLHQNNLLRVVISDLNDQVWVEARLLARIPTGIRQDQRVADAILVAVMDMSVNPQSWLRLQDEWFKMGGVG